MIQVFIFPLVYLFSYFGFILSRIAKEELKEIENPAKKISFGITIAYYLLAAFFSASFILIIPLILFMINRFLQNPLMEKLHLTLLYAVSFLLFQGNPGLIAFSLIPVFLLLVSNSLRESTKEEFINLGLVFIFTVIIYYI